MTVGRDLFAMSPLAAFVIVAAHSLVLFLFASQGLEHVLARAGLPTIPLVPVSSSQAVIGAVIGIGLLKGGRGIRYRLLGNIAAGWVTTPVIAGVLCFVALFFLQNVFDQKVYRPVTYELSRPVLERIAAEGIDVEPFRDLAGERFDSAMRLVEAVEAGTDLGNDVEQTIARLAKLDPLRVDASKLADLDEGLLTEEQATAVRRLNGKRFDHPWMLDQALARQSPQWRSRPDTKANKLYNRALDEKRRALYNLFRIHRMG